MIPLHSLYSQMLGESQMNQRQKMNFAIAYGTATGLIHESIETRSLRPLRDFIAAGQYEYTMKFVKPALQIMQEYELNNLRIIPNSVPIHYPGGFTGVQFVVIKDDSTDELIFLNPSGRRITGELEIFAGLTSHFSPAVQMGQVNGYVNWVLAKQPEVRSVPVGMVPPRNAQDIINAIVQIMNVPTSKRLMSQNQSHRLPRTPKFQGSGQGTGRPTTP